MSEEYKSVTMPDNVITKGTFLGIPSRRWIEAVIADAVVILIITKIPFVTGAKIMFSLIAFMAISLLFVRGIKNRSVIQILFSYIRYRRRRRRLHLCSPNYVKRIKYEEVANESFVEYAGRIIKKRTDEFVNKYDSEEDGEDSQKNKRRK